MSREDTNIYDGETPGWRFQLSQSSEVIKSFRELLAKERCSPEDSVHYVDERERWSERLVLDMLLGCDEGRDIERIEWFLGSCLTLLASCPDSSYIDKGIDNALGHLNKRMISVRFLTRHILRNLWFITDYRQVNKNGDQKEGAIAYYYTTVTVLAFGLHVYISMLEGERKPDRMFDSMEL
jgi:hypothetical protein